MTSEMEPLFDPRYDAIVDLTDPTPPSIDISSDDEWTPQLIVDLTTFQWIVDLTTTNDGDDEAKFADELACKFL